MTRSDVLEGISEYLLEEGIPHVLLQHSITIKNVDNYSITVGEVNVYLEKFSITVTHLKDLQKFQICDPNSLDSLVEAIKQN